MALSKRKLVQAQNFPASLTLKHTGWSNEFGRQGEGPRKIASRCVVSKTLYRPRSTPSSPANPARIQLIESLGCTRERRTPIDIEI